MFLYDIEEGELLTRFVGHKGTIKSCDYSPDGSRIISAGDDNNICLWDANSELSEDIPLFTLKDHKEKITFCSFSKDGSKIISASHDGTVKIWDATASD